MGRRFIDLHVHSDRSGGVDSREAMEAFAAGLGVRVSFCDGAEPEDGVELVFSSKGELRAGSLKAPYLILRPLSAEALARAVKIKRAVIDAPLKPGHARSMHENGCAVEFNLSRLIGASGIERVRAIRMMRSNLVCARKYAVPMVAATGACSVYDLRSAHQVYWLLKVLGFSDSEAKEAMYGAPQGILEQGRAVVEGRVVEEGVVVL